MQTVGMFCHPPLWGRPRNPHELRHNSPLNLGVLNVSSEFHTRFVQGMEMESE